MNEGTWGGQIRQQGPEPRTEPFLQQAKVAVPSDIYFTAIFKGIVWAVIVFLVFMAVRALDRTIGINLLTPKDTTKFLNYYVPPVGTQAITARKESDTTFVVDVPLTQICSRVNLEIPKGKWLYILNVTPIDVELPSAKPANKKLTRFKAARYGGYLTLSEFGNPYYIMMCEMDRRLGVPNPHSFYGAPQVIVDNLVDLAAEQIGYRANRRQPVYFAVNLYDDGSVILAKGFYRIRFTFTHNKFGR